MVFALSAHETPLGDRPRSSPEGFGRARSLYTTIRPHPARGEAAASPGQPRTWLCRLLSHLRLDLFYLFKFFFFFFQSCILRLAPSARPHASARPDGVAQVLGESRWLFGPPARRSQQSSAGCSCWHPRPCFGASLITKTREFPISLRLVKPALFPVVRSRAIRLRPRR